MCPFLICHRAIGVDILVFRRSTYEPSSFVTRISNPAVEQVALIERSMSKVTVCQEDIREVAVLQGCITQVDLISRGVLHRTVLEMRTGEVCEA